MILSSHSLQLLFPLFFILNSFNSHSFINAINSQSSIQFLAIGDWGKGGVNGDITTIISSYYQITDIHQHKTPIPVEYEPDKEVVDHSSFEITSNKNKNKNGKDGDKNKNIYTYQVAIAGAMSRWISQQNLQPQFILALGDNFYDNGVLSINDTRWITHWKQVYLQNYTNLRIPWYPVFGNHDYGYGQQGLQAQMNRKHVNDYTNNLWQFPNTNYSKLFPIPGEGGGMIGIVFVDTTTLAPSKNKCCNQNGGVSEEQQQALIENQISHLHLLFQNLTSYNLTWLLVVGHYPIFSRGEHGDFQELSKNLLPLLIQYNVTAYLCGHDHISEHLQAYGVEFFVSGAGSMTSYLSTTSEASLLWSGTGYSAFTSFEASLNSLTIKYIRYDDTVVYNYTLWKNISAKVEDQIDNEKPGDGDGEDEDGKDNDEGDEGEHDDHNEPSDDQYDGADPTQVDTSHHTGDQLLFFLPSSSLHSTVVKVLGMSIIITLAFTLFGVTLFFLNRRSSTSASASSSYTGPPAASPADLPPPPLHGSTLPLSSNQLSNHMKKSHQKKKINFHSLPLHEEDHEDDQERLIHLSQCSPEKQIFTSSLHSPRSSSSLSLPYPKGVHYSHGHHHNRHQQGSNHQHKKVKSMSSVEVHYGK